MKTLTLATEDFEVQDRTVTGLLIPYNKNGYSGMGIVSFETGSVTIPEDISRVKLLMQHDQERSLGKAVELWEEEDGLHAKFDVAQGEAGDNALAELADGRRDGLSAGVRLTDESLSKIYEQMNSGSREAVYVSGELLEGSMVSIPAFADARASHTLAAAADEDILTLNWNQDTISKTTKENTDMTETQIVDEPIVVAAAPAVVTREAAVYTFNGAGPSLVRDAYNARFNYDSEASERLHRFNADLKDGGTSNEVLALAVDTRATKGGFISDPTYRPDLLINQIDRGRPLISRLNTVGLTDATPFRIPVAPSFSGVGNHTEGTAHVAEGTLGSIGSVTINPGAVSGAYRLSRELIDASNPAIDSIALAAMLRDYRTVTETKVVQAIVSGGGTVTFSINTVAKLRGVLNSFQDREDIPADDVIASTGFYGNLLNEVDSTGRPMLPFVGPTNAVGTNNAGYTGASVDGTEIVKASTVPTNAAFIFQRDAILVGESSTQTFRFDEVEGPGVIKLALFGYFAAAVTRPTGVQRISGAAS